MKKIIIASNNQGKVREFKQLLEPLGYEVMSQSEAGIFIEAEETGNTFEENARIKAEAVIERCVALGLTAAVIADDSGLCVDALGGEPGVHTANYDIPWLLKKLENVPADKRTARFVCCIHYTEGGINPTVGEKVIAEMCEGWIGFECKGENGFGYDPVFMMDTHSSAEPHKDKALSELSGKSFAEMCDNEKNAISHRGKALQKLMEELV
jgi:XTP/dITP diphosphohydrolase